MIKEATDEIVAKLSLLIEKRDKAQKAAARAETKDARQKQELESRRMMGEANKLANQKNEEIKPDAAAANEAKRAAVVVAKAIHMHCCAYARMRTPAHARICTCT